MAVPNVQRLLYLRNVTEATPTGSITRTIRFDEFQQNYHFEPDGVNCYYGLDYPDTVSHFQSEHTALLQHHKDLFEDVLAALARSTRPDKTVVFGLWPYQPGNPFVYVDRNLDLIGQLARELNQYQVTARNGGKRLNIVVRFASEMNDICTAGQPWGRLPGLVNDQEQQEKYKASLRSVREVFRNQAPDVAFTFSPAIRADIDSEEYAAIASYWPGDEVIDRISCTWFVGEQANLEPAFRVLRQYLTERAPRGLPFGIDEMGGVDGDHGNDAMLQQMLGLLAGLANDGITFQYVTIFLESKWGKDAKLEFLRDGSG